MRIDRDTATVIAYGYPIAEAELDFDASGMAGYRLVHRVVQDFRGEVVKASFVGATDIHTGTTSYRFQAFENLNVFGRIIVGILRERGVKEIRHGANIRSGDARASSIRYG